VLPIPPPIVYKQATQNRVDPNSSMSFEVFSSITKVLMEMKDMGFNQIHGKVQPEHLQYTNKEGVVSLFSFFRKFSRRSPFTLKRKRSQMRLQRRNRNNKFYLLTLLKNTTWSLGEEGITATVSNYSGRFL